jgi:paraquat-inducible protein A
MSAPRLIACHECDLLQHLRALPPGATARCRRCGAVLYRHKHDSLNRTLAFSIAGLLLFAVTNTFPFLTLKMQGQVTETRLITGVLDLYTQGMWGLAALVLVTTMLVPALELTLMLYVLVPLQLGRVPWRLPQAFRLLRRLTPWSMLEVFMLGVLVAIVKLVAMATIVPGLALWAFASLIVVLAAAAACLDPHLVWDRVRDRA